MIASMRKRKASRRSNAEAEALMHQNKGLVGMVLAKYFPTLPRDDYFHVGLEGLFRAAQLFDESRGVAFSTYACRAIWSRIKRFLIEDEAPAKHEPLGSATEPRCFDDIGGAEELDRHAAAVQRIAAELLQHLSDRQRSILLARLSGQTLSEIGAALGVCKERIRQVETDAITKMRKAKCFSQLRREFTESLARVSG